MALSDCEKCWNTPCDCGWEYRDWSVNHRIERAAAVLGIDVDVLCMRVAGLIPAEHPMKQAARTELRTPGLNRAAEIAAAYGWRPARTKA